MRSEDDISNISASLSNGCLSASLISMAIAKRAAILSPFARNTAFGRISIFSKLVDCFGFYYC